MRHDRKEQIMKVNLYIVQGEHFSQPGHIMKHFTDAHAATAEAVSLVNIMLDDSDFYEGAHVNASNWEKGVAELQGYHGAAHCDVWIDETEISVPDPTPAPEKKFLLALDLSSGIDLQHFDTEAARDAALWELAFHSTANDHDTVELFRTEYEQDDYDVSDAMEDAEIGFLTDEVFVVPARDDILVVIEGASVQDVVAYGAAIGTTITVVDYDTEGGDKEDFTDVLQADGQRVDAYVRKWTVEKSAIVVMPKGAA